jgi:hypothetical protein
MRLHLGGWQRIGIVASVLWLMAAVVFGFFEANRWAEARFYQTIEKCSQERGRDAYLRCIDKMDEGGGRKTGLVIEMLEYDAVISLVPIVFGWMLAYAGVGVWRWVRRGFNSSYP